MATKQMVGKRHWSFTFNRPEATEVLSKEKGIDKAKDLDVLNIKYIVFQKEKGAHLHYQGYVEFKTGVRFSSVRKLFGGGGHWEPCKASPQHNYNYCTKKATRIDGPWSFGQISSGCGKRSDIVEFRDAIKTGKRRRDLYDDDFQLVLMAKYPRLYTEIHLLNRPKRVDKPKLRVVLAFGKTRTGKTRWAYDNWLEFYEMPITNGQHVWWDGYDLHLRVLLDDFCGASSHVRLDTILKLLDRYPRKVPVKHGHTWYLPYFIYVTTNLHPRDWYTYTGREEMYNALCARFTEVWNFDEAGAEINCKDTFFG